MKNTYKVLTLLMIVASLFPSMFVAYAQKTEGEFKILRFIQPEYTYEYTWTTDIVEESPAPIPSPEVLLYSEKELNAIVQTLVGECYDDKLTDKRLVVEVILNRVSDGRFGDTVLEVVTAKGQFAGYWAQSRPISESDIQIAKEALTEWYNNDCQKLSDYLYFCSGPNRENIFRTNF